MIEDVFARRALNYLYISISETIPKLPFSGRHWLAEVSKGVALKLLEEHASKEMFLNKKPLEICRAYIKLLEDINLIASAESYKVEGIDTNSLKITLERAKCIYIEFCKEAQKEGYFFQCPRITSLQAVLEWSLDKKYNSSMDIDHESEICCGKVFEQKKTLDEIVTREEHILNIAGKRAILLPKITYSSIIEAIKSYAPHILKHVLYDAGYKSALPIAEKAKDMHPDALEYLNILFEELKNAGLGKVVLQSLNTSTGEAVIWCYDSFQIPAEEYEANLYRTPRVVCDFLRGTFSAYLSVYFEKEIICEEMSCQSVDGNYCEFVSFPLEKENLPGGESFDQKRKPSRHPSQIRAAGLFSS
ncbi:V4R domain-containing protein [Desulfolucanica intricata]|uniref:V4R domain-containing protein n=1 Tax=Desulfolucanica intricata TaxID=1285191 RepID=UPI00082E88DF|nr:4-vinyl reductase [Desulfolucanica intricata]